MEKEFVYIYNTEQALWYIRQGLIPVDMGTASKGDAYLKYENNDEYKTLFKKWCLRNK